MEIKGYLINIYKAVKDMGGFKNNALDWRSSLTRHDTGPNSCEIIWVEGFNLHD